MPEFRSTMPFDSLLYWFEKTHGKHAADDEQQWETDGGAVKEEKPDEVTSEGGVKLPPISGGVPDGE